MRELSGDVGEILDHLGGSCTQIVKNGQTEMCILLYVNLSNGTKF